MLIESEPPSEWPTRRAWVPYRAACDPDLSAGALRLLIALACHADERGWCTIDVDRLTAATGLSSVDLAQFSRQLSAAFYVVARLQGPCWRFQIVTDPVAGEPSAHAPEPADEWPLQPSPRSADAPSRPRAVTKLLRAWRGADRFRLWLRTVLSPGDTDLFWTWALGNDADYHELVRRFGDADDDAALDALSKDTAAIAAAARTADQHDGHSVARSAV